MASQDIEIRIKTALDTLGASQGVGDLKRSLRELKGLALETGDSNTDAFKRITAAIGETNDRIGDLNAVIKSQSGEPVENLSSSFQGLKGNLLSLDLKSFKQQFSVFSSTINDLTGNVFSGFNVQKNYNIALAETNSKTKAAKIATMEFSAALAATGIGVLVIALGALIANFDKLKDVGGGLGSLFQGISGAIDGMTNSLKYFSDALQLTNFKQQEQTRQRILDLSNSEKAITRFYDTEIKLAEASGENTEQLYKNRDMLLLASIKKSQDILNKSYIENKGLSDEEGEESKRLAQLKYDIESNAKIRNAALRKKEADDKKKESENEIADADRKSKEQQRINERTARENERISKETAIRKYQETLEDEKRFKSQSDLEIEFSKTTAQADADWAEIAALNKSLTYEQILQKLSERYKREFDLAEKSQKDLADLAKKKSDEDILDQERFISIEQFKRDTKISNAEFDRLWEEEAKKNTLATYDEILDAVIKRYEGEVDAAKKARDEKFQLAQDFVTGFQNLNEIVGSIEMAGLKKGTEEYDRAARKKFEINKALQLSSAVITGIQSVMDAFANGMKNPIPLLGPATATVYAVMAGIASAANIAKISATQYQSTASTTPSSTTPPPPAGPPPTTNILAPSTIGLGQMSIMPQRQQNNWQKVYVVESDIRNTTNRVEVIENRSVLGS